jgi:plasmid stabilization system protein ParE
MRIQYTEQALDDLESISAYYRAISTNLANGIVSEIERRIGQLAALPLIAPETDEPGIHELIVIRYPYKVYYRIDDHRVVIMHIRDARRRPWRSRE